MTTVSSEEHVVLVDALDRALGTMEKLRAHEQAALHRAFSVFVVRQRDGQHELLLQLRARSKYHFGGLWTNTCCGHPRDGESPVAAGQRRLPEEMNFACALEAIGSFVYRATSENGLIEHELDHVLLGRHEGEVPAPNPGEAEAVRWVALAALDRELSERPSAFTPWFAASYALVKRALTAPG
jgi:isopentenyl-diphosphate delta-isomerase